MESKSRGKKNFLSPLLITYHFGFQIISIYQIIVKKGRVVNMMSKWVYLLIGDDKTGKTTFQKCLINHLCGKNYARLDINRLYDITHSNAPKHYKKAFFMNRSYQEKFQEGIYSSLDDFFNNHFKDADVCFLSSHLNQNDIVDIIKKSHERFYNVGGVFFSNSIQSSIYINQQISKLSIWDERFTVQNPLFEGDFINIFNQLNNEAKSFIDIIVHRSQFQ